MSKKIVKIGNVNAGEKGLFLIAGPCVVEEESIMMQTAETLKKISERLNIPLIFKSSFQKDNRSSVDFFKDPVFMKV
jgi:2-dehydro-3-deoxyphosphooctonate aldolase (KDO 8-P synthase)